MIGILVGYFVACILGFIIGGVIVHVRFQHMTDITSIRQLQEIKDLKQELENERSKNKQSTI